MAAAVGALLLGAELAGFTLLAIGATTLTLGTVVGTAVLAAGAIGLQLLLTPRLPNEAPGSPLVPPPESGHQPLRQSIAPRIVGLGDVRLAGAYVLFEAKDGVSYDLVAFHHGKVEAILGYYLHDDVVTIDETGIVDEQGDGRYGDDKISIATRLGLATETAYTELTSALPEIWTSDHRGDGLASLLLICGSIAAVEDFPTIYPRGKPEPSVVARCTPVYDPRDGDQDREDPGTWLASSNPVLQLLFYLTDADRGMGFDWDTLIEPVVETLMAKATICDQLVEKADGSFEKRYQSNGSYPLDADPADVLNTLLETCDGWISENGDGTLALEVGSFVNPDFTLASRHVLGAALQFGVPEEEAVNELTIDYTAPQLDYKTSPGEPWRDETDISERGRVLSQRMALPWVYSHSQARRLAKRRMTRLNAPLRGTLTTTLYGIQALGRRWIAIEAPAVPALGNVVVEVLGVTVDLLNARCAIKFVSVDPLTIDAWDKDTEEGSPPVIPEKLIAPAPPVPANVDGDATLFLEGAKFDVSFDDPGRADLDYQIRWRIFGSGDPYSEDARTPGTLDAGRVHVLGGFDAPAGTYEVGVRSFAPSGPGSSYSSSVTIVVP